jgi:urea carboxylase
MGSSKDTNTGFADMPPSIEEGGIRFLIAGDRFVLVEVGEGMELSLNIKVIRLATRILAENVGGIIEALPMFVSVLIHYDSLVLSPQRLRTIVESVWKEMAGEVDNTLASRLIELPVYYCDPLTRDCVEQYSRHIAAMEDNPTFVAKINGLSGPEELVRRHTSTQHWVAGIGFYAGTPELLPLDPRVTLSVPKYNPPRLFTVGGAIGVGGGFTSIYPIDSPGGYYIIGRTPTPIYSLDTRLVPFREKATLLNPGDRIKFRRIFSEENEFIEAQVKAGTYRYLIWDYEFFSFSRYTEWLADLEPAADLI